MITDDIDATTLRARETPALRRAREEGVLFLPASFLAKRGISAASVAPSWLVPAAAILEDSGSIGDLSHHLGGRAAKGKEATVVSRPGGGMPIIVVHDKETEAAEIEDLASEALERKPINFEESRERQGLPSAKQFDILLREAATDYIRRAKQSRVTIKPRDARQQFVKGLVTVPALPFAR